MTLDSMYPRCLNSLVLDELDINSTGNYSNKAPQPYNYNPTAAGFSKRRFSF